MVFALTEVLRLKKFWQADDLSAASGGVGDTFEGFLQIWAGLWAARHLDESDTEFIRGQAGNPQGSI